MSAALCNSSSSSSYGLLQSLSHELRSVRKENDLLWRFLHHHQLSEGVQNELCQFLGTQFDPDITNGNNINPNNQNNNNNNRNSNIADNNNNNKLNISSPGPFPKALAMSQQQSAFGSVMMGHSNSRDSESEFALRDSSVILKSGFLLKKGRTFGSWKSRYFVLKPDRLEYYKSKKKSSTLLGYIPLSESVSVLKPKSEANEGSYSCAFAIRNELVSLSKMFIASTEAVNSLLSWLASFIDMLDLIQLQGHVKRDPISYKQEFMEQYNHFESMIRLFEMNPGDENDNLVAIISFLSHTSVKYDSKGETFAQKIYSFLDQHFLNMNAFVRKSMVQSLVMLRSKGQIPTVECQDSELRDLLYSNIVQSIKLLNQKHKDNKLNKTLQNLMYSMLTETLPLAAKKSLDVMIALYKKNIWNDAKTVNIISEACLSQHEKVANTAVHFFLGHDDEEEDGSDEENESNSMPNLLEMRHAAHVAKKTKARKTKMRKALSLIKKKEKKANSAESFNFSAIHLLNDPQGFSEKLFEKLRRTKGLDHGSRLGYLNLISRIIGIHKLFLLSYYPFISKYLKPKERDVTMLLTYAAQACHDLVPPDVIENMILAVANNFVSDSYSAEVITVGLNCIRQISNRCSFGMPQYLLTDLIEYKNYRDKGVSNAARSLIQLFREVNPEFLPRKERGKEASMNIRSDQHSKVQYGQVETQNRILGAEELDDQEDKSFEALENEWEIEEQSDQGSEDDQGWINIDDDSGRNNIKIELSDEEEEEDDDDDDDEMEHNENDKSTVPIEQRKILTPQDFARLDEIRRKEQVDKVLGVKRKSDIFESKEIIEVKDIEESLRRRKQNYDERMESIAAGREGREKYGSRKGKKDKLTSSTNKEKIKKKNFIMSLHARSVRLKSKMSMRDKQIALRAHAVKQKKRKG